MIGGNVNQSLRRLHPNVCSGHAGRGTIRREGGSSARFFLDHTTRRSGYVNGVRMSFTLNGNKGRKEPSGVYAKRWGGARRCRPERRDRLTFLGSRAVVKSRGGKGGRSLQSRGK